jgi:hypothetical protein
MERQSKHLEQELKPCREGISKLEAVNGSSSIIEKDKSFIQNFPNLEAYDNFLC